MLEAYRHLVALKADRRGVTALEYAIIAGVLGAILAVAFKTYGTNLQTFLTGITF